MTMFAVTASFAAGNEGRHEQSLMELCRNLCCERIRRQSFPQRNALCIGVGYRSDEAYEPLRHAVTDAQALGAALHGQGYNVRLMVEGARNPALRPTGLNIIAQMRAITESCINPDDTLIVTFAGHADMTKAGPVLVPVGRRSKHELIRLTDLADLLGDCVARKKLLVLDVYRSPHGASSRLMPLTFETALKRTLTCSAMISSAADQSSLVDVLSGKSQLTAALIDGLRGDAFRKGKALMTIPQLYLYVLRTFAAKRRGRRAQYPWMFSPPTVRAEFDIAARPQPAMTTPRRAEPLHSSYDTNSAERLVLDGEYGCALDRLSSALAAHGLHASALALRARCFGALGYWHKALQDAKAACESDASNAMALDVRGKAHFNAFSYVAARRDLRAASEAIARCPWRWPALASPKETALRWLALAVSTMHSRVDHVRSADAISACDLALDVDGAPESIKAPALCCRALAQLHQDRREEAIRDLSAVISMRNAPAGWLAAALFSRGTVYGLQGRDKERLDDYVRASWVMGTRFRIQPGLARRLNEYFTDAAESVGGPPAVVASALCGRGGLYVSERRYDRATSDFTRVVEMKGTPPQLLTQALALRGHCNYGMGHLDIALYDYQDAFRRDGGMHALAYRIGLVLLQLGKTDEARNAYRRALDIASPSHEAIGNLARLCRSSARHPEALAFMGWLQKAAGDDERGSHSIMAYLNAYPNGSAAAWAKEVIELRTRGGGMPSAAPSLAMAVGTAANFADLAVAGRYMADVPRRIQVLRRLKRERRHRAALKHALGIRESIARIKNSVHVYVLTEIASLHMSLGEYDDAEKWCNRALKMSQNMLNQKAKSRISLTDIADQATSEAMSLCTLGTLHYHTGSFRDAKAFLTKGVKIYQEVESPHIDKRVNALAWLGKAFEAMSDVRRAEQSYVRAMELCARLGEQWDATRAALYNSLGRLHRTVRDYRKAEACHVKALERLRCASNWRTSAATLTALGSLYNSTAQYQKANDCYQDALDLARDQLPEGSGEEAGALLGLARLQESLGDRSGAEKYYAGALNVACEAYGKSSPSIVPYLIAIAHHYRILGTQPAAVAHGQRALEVLDSAGLHGHPDMATALRSIGYMYWALRDLRKAAQILHRATEEVCSLENTRHPFIASLNMDLGMVYREMGISQVAREFLRNALRAGREVLGSCHPQTVRASIELAELLVDMDRPLEAMSLLKESYQAVTDRAAEATVVDASTLDRLGRVYTSVGSYRQGEACLRGALDVRHRLLGEEHPAVCQTRKSLASLYYRAGRSQDAEVRYLDVMRLMKKNGWRLDPMYVSALTDLAVLYRDTSRCHMALPLLREARSLNRQRVDMVFGFADEQTKLAFVQSVHEEVDALLSIAVKTGGRNHQALIMAANTVLQTKGLTLEALLVQPEPSEYTRVCQAIGKMVLTDSGERRSASYRDRLRILQERREELKAQRTDGSRWQFSSHVEKSTVATVAAALPQEAALVEIVKYGGGGRRKESHGGDRYVAFVIRPAGSVPPVLVDLGDAERIDRAVQTFRRAVEWTGSWDSATRISTGLSVDPSVLARAREWHREDQTTVSVALERLLFSPIRPHLEVAKRVFISPDSDVALVPFEALMDRAGHFLIEDYTFSYLTAGRDITRCASSGTPRDGVAIFGCNRFGAIGSGDRGLIGAPGAAVGVMRPRISKDMGDMTFPELKFAESEAQAIGEILSVQKHGLMLGEDATERAVKGLRGPRILHLATHGFFLPDQAERLSPGDQGMYGAGTLVIPNDAASGRRMFTYENPLLRSGLALARANAWRDAIVAGSAEDGVLTAMEAADLDLASTDMVVLSACDTGMGRAPRGEGVFGLQRAFFQAGAKSVLMSLWKVPDHETAELMKRYYRQWWLAGADKASALRRAQLAMLQSQRDGGDRAHPRFWAGFVLMGDWRGRHGETSTPMAIGRGHAHRVDRLETVQPPKQASSGVLSPGRATAGPQAAVAHGLSELALASAKRGEMDGAIHAYTLLIGLRDVRPDLLAGALVNRAWALSEKGLHERAMVDYARAIEMRNAPRATVASALYNRAVLHGSRGSIRQEIADYTRVIEMPDVPADTVAESLYNRAVAYRDLRLPAREVADYTRVLHIRNAPVEQVAKSLGERGNANRELGQHEKAIADYTRVIDMSSAPLREMLKASVNRASLHLDHGRTAEAIADCTRVTESPACPHGLMGDALFVRAEAFTTAKQIAKAIGDYSRIVDMRQGHVSTARALALRGRCYYIASNLKTALEDYRRARELGGGWPELAYDTGLALLRMKEFDEARKAYAAAISACMPYDEAMNDLIAARDRFSGPPETAVFLGFLRIAAGREEQGREDIRSYLDARPNGRAARWAQSILEQSQETRRY